MRLQYTQLPTLLGSLVLCAGLTTTLANAQGKEESDGDVGKVVEDAQQQSDGGQAEPESKADEHEGMVQVRVSLPDGRTIVTYEKPAARSARVSPNIARQVNRFRATASVSRSSAHSSRSSSSGGASSGGSAMSSGGGASVRGGNSSSVSSGGGAVGDAGVTTFSGSKGDTSSGSSSKASASARSRGSSGSNRATAGGGGSAPTSTGRSVPTVGNARHHAEGAIGGQRVEFHDAGMGAAVVGNTVYFTGVQLVQADQGFETIDGTRIGADTVIMQEGRLSPDGSGPLSSWNTGTSAIKMEFESNTVVDLVMFSEPENENNPERIQRTWTVRIR